MFLTIRAVNRDGVGRGAVAIVVARGRLRSDKDAAAEEFLAAVERDALAGGEGALRRGEAEGCGGGCQRPNGAGLL